MNVNRLIWTTTTALFGLIGFLLGLSLGRLYATFIIISGTAKESLQMVVTATLSVGIAIVMARFGSWLADRYLLDNLSHLKQVSAADKVLGIVGVLLGVLFAVLVTLPLPNSPVWWLPVKLCAMAVCSVFGMALLQGMREEMLHVFPALESDHSSSGAGAVPKILDTNIIIDGRMADICKTGFIEGPLFVPSFVLEEVQYIADSGDSLKRARGRRGLDVLNTMRELMVEDPAHPEKQAPAVQIISEFPASVRKTNTVDSKLVVLAKEIQAAIVTNDFNLNRVAELQGVRVLNINELVHALRPVVLPGEEMRILVLREGKEPGQGVGYLDDGTMVVVSEGRSHIGETCVVTISSVIQTVAGKMIFAELKAEEKEANTVKGPGSDLFDDSTTKRSDSSSSGNDGSYRSGGGVRRKSRP